MPENSDYFDDEKYEKMYVSWKEVNKLEDKLKAEGWFRLFDSGGYGYVAADMGADVFFRARPDYVPLEDKMLVCQDCQKNFTFTVDEQRFFKKKGFVDPKRCPDCRKKRKS